MYFLYSGLNNCETCILLRDISHFNLLKGEFSRQTNHYFFDQLSEYYDCKYLTIIYFTSGQNIIVKGKEPFDELKEVFNNDRYNFLVYEKHNIIIPYNNISYIKVFEGVNVKATDAENEPDKFYYEDLKGVVYPYQFLTIIYLKDQSMVKIEGKDVFNSFIS